MIAFHSFCSLSREEFARLIGELLEHLADMAVLICSGTQTSQRDPLAMEADQLRAPPSMGVCNSQ